MRHERADDDTVDFDVPELTPMAAPVPLVQPELALVEVRELQAGQVGIVAPGFPPIVVRPPAQPGKSAVAIVIEAFIKSIQIFGPIQPQIPQ